MAPGSRCWRLIIMPSGSRGSALESGLLHRFARHNPLLCIKHLRFRAGHHRRCARQAASGCPSGYGGEGEEALGSRRLTPANPRKPISRVCGTSPFRLFRGAALLEQEGGASLREWLGGRERGFRPAVPEKLTWQKPFRRSSYHHRAIFPSISSCWLNPTSAAPRPASRSRISPRTSRGGLCCKVSTSGQSPTPKARRPACSRCPQVAGAIVPLSFW